MLVTRSSVLACGLGVALSLHGCSSEPERPPGLDSGTAGAGQAPEGPECEPPPEVDTTESCGEETVQLVRRQPTVYFVLDVSGSMGDFVLDGDDTKLDAAKTALETVAQDIGHRAKYGLAVFPGEAEDFDPDDEDAPAPGCFPGEEVFSVRAGDPIECVNLPPGGPVLTAFKRELKQLTALGGTPLSSTLAEIAPTLMGQEGSTAVVLITDGAPNCNNDAECDIEDCEYNQESRVLLNLETQNYIECDETINCCDPDLVAEYLDRPQLGCRDIAASELELATLANSGVYTYVVGVLGSADFDDAMNRLAISGGRPREGERLYYDVSSLDELTDTVRAIGLNLTQSCEIELLERPLYANELNVYFDAEVVPSDPDDGWTLDNDVVTFFGEACTRIQAGEVERIQLISGCKTVVR